ncbi:magnesium transporter MRS2 homolog, mitochondrial [Protobothrops mucrosquamatus]|uniref:magnesium transporter MRS2 homolog, mitochondrial n=1 Tax=Protobothrops mucrosquamatus TaxID=103944 RepID=UPI000775F8BB|nr:magnesium transporter MRS2 homolog, mitochondrial [Protobothrops mucrosquamatus]
MECVRLLRQRLRPGVHCLFGRRLCCSCSHRYGLLLGGSSWRFPGAAGGAPLGCNSDKCRWRRSGGQSFLLCAYALSRHCSTEVTQATLASVAPVFSVMKFDTEGNVTSYERKKTELHQELSLQARDLRFQHQVNITPRNNKIIMRMEFLKAVITPEYLLILDYRNSNMEKWLFQELASQLAGEGQLVTYSLPFEFRAIEAILQFWISYLTGKLSHLQPQILETLNALVDPKLLSLDRSKVHILLQNGKSLSELETDLKVFKETILEILDDKEVMEELCLTKWTDPEVFEASLSGIDHVEEMELLLENYYRQAEDLMNETRELKILIDDSESIIFINLDSHRNVMMRLNLQLTMGTFSISLFGLIGVAFGMNLESSFEENHGMFWLVTGIMFLGSGLIWRRLLTFLGRHLEPSMLPPMPTLLKKAQSANGKVEFKNVFKTESFESSRSTMTSQ